MISSPSFMGARVILLAGLTCGVLDLASALVLSRLKGITPRRLLQTIASGVLGPKSFDGGSSTATLGAAIHFVIAFVAAGIYYAASRKVGVLVEYAVLCGLLYGIAVHLFMSFVVLPLSAIRRPFSVNAFLIQLVVHMFFVGLPISLVVRHFA